MVRWIVVTLVAIMAIWLVTIGVLVVSGRRSAARELATLLPNLLSLFRGLLGDPQVPTGSKILLWLALVWVISPIDLVPEFVPIVGPVDDAIVAALVLRHVIRSAGPEVVSEHWRGDPATLERILRIVGAR